MEIRAMVTVRRTGTHRRKVWTPSNAIVEARPGDHAGDARAIAAIATRSSPYLLNCFGDEGMHGWRSGRSSP